MRYHLDYHKRFIINKNLQELYYKEKGLVQSITLNRSIVDYAVNGTINYSMKPIFSSTVGTKDIIRKSDSLAIPITYTKYGMKPELYMMIQLEWKNFSTDSKTAYSKELSVYLIYILDKK